MRDAPKPYRPSVAGNRRPGADSGSRLHPRTAAGRRRTSPPSAVGDRWQTEARSATAYSAKPPSRWYPVNTAASHRFSRSVVQKAAHAARAAEPRHADAIAERDPRARPAQSSVDDGADDWFFLVSRNDRMGGGPGELAVEQVQIGAADAAGGHAHAHLAGPRLGPRDLPRARAARRRGRCGVRASREHASAALGALWRLAPWRASIGGPNRGRNPDAVRALALI
jgi:hypothetical protein